jgi:hypothetical protein
MRQLRGLAKRLWVLLVAERYKHIGRGSEGTWIKLSEKAFTSLGMNYGLERQGRAAVKRAGALIVLLFQLLSQFLEGAAIICWQALGQLGGPFTEQF